MAEKNPLVAIDYFNSKSLFRKIATRVAFGSRKKQFQILLQYFESMLKPGCRVLDLGTTPDRNLPESNFFIKHLVDFGVDITLCSIEDCQNIADELGAEFIFFSDLEKLAPQKKWDLVLSIATIEHVGNWQKQEEFARLIQRIGDCYFVTTPNRWFPIEFHTFLPLMHWLPKKMNRTLLRGILRKPFWAEEANLNLLGSELKDLFCEESQRVIHDYVYLWGLPSNHLLFRVPLKSEEKEDQHNSNRKMTFVDGQDRRDE